MNFTYSQLLQSAWSFWPRFMSLKKTFYVIFFYFLNNNAISSEQKLANASLIDSYHWILLGANHGPLDKMKWSATITRIRRCDKFALRFVARNSISEWALLCSAKLFQGNIWTCNCNCGSRLARSNKKVLVIQWQIIWYIQYIWVHRYTHSLN